MTLTNAELRLTLVELVGERDGQATTTMGAGSDDLETARRYLKVLSDGGWAVPGWPREHGGRGASDDEIQQISAVLGELQRPDLYPYTVGLNMVGPTVLEHGTNDQRARWLRSIADGSQIWCQMFSEPSAGSDLANVATRAVPVEGGWALTGQKVWTSRGAYARMGLCLARTDPDVPKHRGLTMFAVRMDAPGVDVRPLLQMNGDSHFSEVFLDDAVVSDADRIGPVGAGWAVAMTVLTHERGQAGQRIRAEDPAALPSWLLDLDAQGRLDDPLLRSRAMIIYVRERVAQLTALRSDATKAAGRHGPESSGQKLRWSSTLQARAYLVKDAFGAHGMLEEHPGHVDVITAPSLSIRGGTDEIQRNIVAERVLGLPPDVRVDRDAPWSVARFGVGHPDVGR